tara:strand:- start:499 stop:1257 length:759 start_codon:yes stop_codon:yes gene_type:complete
MRIVSLAFVFSIISAQWSSESAYLLEKNRREIGLFSPYKIGMNSGSEIGVNKFLLMPSIYLKQEAPKYNAWKMARKLRLEYPTPGLKWMQSPLGKEMGDPNMFSLISTQFSIPHMVSFYAGLIGTKGDLKLGQLSLNGGIGIALNGKKLSNDATVDLPVIYPRLSVYYNNFVIKSGGEYARLLSDQLYYIIDYEMYLMPGNGGRYAFEQESVLVWQKSNWLNLSFGYKLIVGEYPFGGQAHLLPTINIKFGW